MEGAAPPPFSDAAGAAKNPYFLHFLSQHLFSNLSQAETEALLFMTNSNWMERSRSKKTRQNFLALDIKNRTPKSILLCTFSQLLQCWDLCQGGSTNPSSLICLIIWHFWHPCLLCYVARVTRFLQIKLQTWFTRFLRISYRAQLG